MLFGEIIGVYCDNPMKTPLRYEVQYKASYIVVDSIQRYHIV